MRLGQWMLAIVMGVTLGWVLPNIFEDKTIRCLPYEISMKAQEERGIKPTGVGKLFAPENQEGHSYWCYQKD